MQDLSKLRRFDLRLIVARLKHNWIFQPCRGWNSPVEVGSFATSRSAACYWQYGSPCDVAPAAIDCASRTKRLAREHTYLFKASLVIEAHCRTARHRSFSIERPKSFSQFRKPTLCRDDFSDYCPEREYRVVGDRVAEVISLVLAVFAYAQCTYRRAVDNVPTRALIHR